MINLLRLFLSAAICTSLHVSSLFFHDLYSKSLRSTFFSIACSDFQHYYNLSISIMCLINIHISFSSQRRCYVQSVSVFCVFDLIHSSFFQGSSKIFSLCCLKCFLMLLCKNLVFVSLLFRNPIFRAWYKLPVFSNMLFSSYLIFPSWFIMVLKYIYDCVCSMFLLFSFMFIGFLGSRREVTKM